MSLSKIKLFYTILCSLTLIGFFTTCKKYDEDGKRSWHKPEKRLLGKWFLKEFSVDGIDSVYKWYDYKTNNITDTVRWQLVNARFSFTNNDEKDKLPTVGKCVDIFTTNIYFNDILNKPYANLHMINKWSLKNNNKELYFSSNYYYSRSTGYDFSIFGHVTDLWDIKKLTDKEMILEAYNNDNKHLRLKFQK